jgi:NADP-dependent 3-hydroxy acid dehydrogenase YdfG
MTKELSGRVAIVTGAGRNIGRGIALALADGGAAVVVNARSNLAEAQSVAREIEQAGGKAIAVTADVADPVAVGKMAAAALERFGRIDILVNNAAVRAEQAFETMTLVQWRAVTSIILDGAFNCVQACLPQLKASGSGVIINIGGLSAHTGLTSSPRKPALSASRALWRTSSRAPASGSTPSRRASCRRRGRRASLSRSIIRWSNRSPAGAESRATSRPRFVFCADRRQASSPGKISRSTAVRIWVKPESTLRRRNTRRKPLWTTQRTTTVCPFAAVKFSAVQEVRDGRRPAGG